MILAVCNVCKSPWVQEIVVIEINTGVRLQQDSIHCPRCGDECGLEFFEVDVEAPKTELDRAMEYLDKRHKKYASEGPPPYDAATATGMYDPEG